MNGGSSSLFIVELLIQCLLIGLGQVTIVMAAHVLFFLVNGFQIAAILVSLRLCEITEFLCHRFSNHLRKLVAFSLETTRVSGRGTTRFTRRRREK